MHKRIISFGIFYVNKTQSRKTRYLGPLQWNKNRNGTGERKTYTWKEVTSLTRNSLISIFMQKQGNFFSLLNKITIALSWIMLKKNKISYIETTVNTVHPLKVSLGNSKTYRKHVLICMHSPSPFLFKYEVLFFHQTHSLQL